MIIRTVHLLFFVSSCTCGSREGRCAWLDLVRKQAPYSDYASSVYLLAYLSILLSFFPSLCQCVGGQEVRASIEEAVSVTLMSCGSNSMKQHGERCHLDNLGDELTLVSACIFLL